MSVRGFGGSVLPSDAFKMKRATGATRQVVDNAQTVAWPHPATRCRYCLATIQQLQYFSTGLGNVAFQNILRALHVAVLAELEDRAMIELEVRFAVGSCP
jgi:hypothetical protein